MNLKDIKALYKFFKTTDLLELESGDDGSRVRFKRGALACDDGPAPALLSQAVPAQKPAPEIVAPVSSASPSKPDENIKTLTSPMVGTFYRASGPESASFTEVGDVVRKGQTLCIIEAMKLMNEVESEEGGKVVGIMVENGQPVEYGEPIFKIEVAR